jgi:hypothetical protein
MVVAGKEEQNTVGGKWKNEGRIAFVENFNSLQ